MLRLVLTLDCDRCRQSYYKAAVSTESESVLWESLAEDVKTCAALDGWKFAEEGAVCDECFEAAVQEVDGLPAVEAICP